MKKTLLLSIAFILLFGMTHKFDGQEKNQSHRQLPPGGNTDIDRQSKMTQTPFFSRQSPNRWATDQALPDQHRITTPLGQRDFRANTTMAGEAFAQHELSAGVDTAWVRDYPSGLLSVFGGTAIAVDGSGNVYVAGSCYYFRSGEDFFTVKYNSSGAQLWGACYKGPGDDRDYATALAVDGSGNVYVTGGSEGSGTGSDFATVKYNSAGAEQWVARYNGPGNVGDQASSIIVDGSGNVYVSGTSVGSGTGDDFATVKYNSNGIEQWVARYNGPGNAGDGASALAVDASGNVYVTGGSEGSSTGSDFATIKYNSAGVQQWVARYNAVENAGDYANALAVDASGNVYVTGENWVAGTGRDFATVKYNSTGAEQWVTRYNGAENWSDYAIALALDASGNVYVTGGSAVSVDAAMRENYDYATVKYNSVGVEQWVARYDRPENWMDYASALVVDASANVYVTGSSATVKYNSEGIQQWETGSGAEALVVDAAGNVYVTGWIGGNFATVKYNTDGIEQWQAGYSGVENRIIEVFDMAIDVFGNVYVLGTSDGLVTYDYATVKYNSAGVQQWVARYKGALDYVAALPALAVDVFGNAYVTGTSYDAGADSYITIKYNSAGIEQWVARYNGPGNGVDIAAAIAVDASGNVYVTGGSEGSGTNQDYATIKYNSDGVQQWVARYHCGSGDEAKAISVDASGNVYVTGRSDGTGAYYDYATIKYNSDGVQQWVARYNGPGISADEASALTVDASGNVYVTGNSWSSGLPNDYATVKYNSDGVEQWVARYNGPGNGWDWAEALVVDASGNVYVTGSSAVSDTLPASYDYATVKYNSAGVEQWVARYDGPVNERLEKSTDQATALTVDASGNVYVTGVSDLWLNADFVTIKYNSAGAEQWIARYDGPRNSSDKARDLAVDASGNVYVTGTSGETVYTIIKYIQTPVSVEKEVLSRPSRYWLAQNYPNPFNPSTTIEFALPKSAFVTLKVYNLQGEEVATLIAEQREAGIHKINWDARGLASGVYLYRLEAGTFTQFRKLILIK